MTSSSRTSSRCSWWNATSTTLDGAPLSAQAVLGVTSLPARATDPERLAALVRGEWAIENRDHYVRDVTLGEDRCRVRTDALPSILAAMRCLMTLARRRPLRRSL